MASASIQEAAPRYKHGENIPQSSIDIMVVHDYGKADLAAQEVIGHLHIHDKNNVLKQPREAPVPHFNTLATGVVIAQLGLYSQHPDLVILSNTAPRGKESEDGQKDTAIPWHGSKEQPLVFALLRTDVPVFFVHSGFAGSAIKDHIRGLWEVDVSNYGEQFRSRNIYARATMDYINGGVPIIGEQLDSDIIPDMPTDRVGYVDGYGNIKTTMRGGQFPETLADQDEIAVAIGDTVVRAKNRVTREGDRVEGDLCVQTGSSGGRRNPYIEVVVMMNEPQSAKQVFGIPDMYGENIVVAFGPHYIVEGAQPNDQRQRIYPSVQVPQ